MARDTVALIHMETCENENNRTPLQTVRAEQEQEEAVMLRSQVLGEALGEGSRCGPKCHTHWCPVLPLPRLIPPTLGQSATHGASLTPFYTCKHQPTKVAGKSHETS